MRALFVLAFGFVLVTGKGQDTAYARRMIHSLCSEKFFGRGYINKGLQKAGDFIVAEIIKYGVKPIFKGGFTQSFTHSVNTFPGKCKVRLNGKELLPGYDYIVTPSSAPCKGTFLLTKADSANFIYAGSTKISVSLKNKLTWSVSTNQSAFTSIELNKSRFTEMPREIELTLEARLNTRFVSKNIGCYFDGSSNSDSMMVFSAHYDHLGGMGSATFFPGANDNASGTSMVLDLIRYYAQHSPRYKTVFLFFAGEEAGLVGSKFFTQSMVMDLKKIKFLINLDLLGTGNDGIMVVNGALFEKEFSRLVTLNNQSGLVKEIKKRGKAANSDHYWFYEAGVPCFFIYTLGGVSAYHDVMDIERTLPLTDYLDVFTLLVKFTDTF